MMQRRFYIEKDKLGKIKQKLKINGVDNLSIEEIQQKINSGYRFIVFNFAIWLIIVLWIKNSSIYFVEPSKSPIIARVAFSLISFFFLIVTGTYFFLIISDSDPLQTMDGIAKIIFLGLLFIGFVFPIPSFVRNICGGKDITEQISEYLKNENI